MIFHEMRDDFGLVVLDRHEKRNALDVEHLTALREGIAELAAEGARVLVVTGAGTTFCSGADLGGVYGDGFRDALYGTLQTITALPLPVIAAVNGPAIGAGTQLAIACDLRVACPTATFAVPTARNGLAVDAWTIRRLALLAGGGPARALLLGCETLNAEQAWRHGLADRVGSLDDALAWAKEISDFAPLSIQYSKTALEHLFEGTPWDSAIDQAFDRCWRSEDFAESKLARGEKRSPRFQGR
jgi:enoyl-CoA hydratase